MSVAEPCEPYHPSHPEPCLDCKRRDERKHELEAEFAKLNRYPSLLVAIVRLEAERDSLQITADRLLDERDALKASNENMSSLNASQAGSLARLKAEAEREWLAKKKAEARVAELERTGLKMAKEFQYLHRQVSGVPCACYPLDFWRRRARELGRVDG